MSTKKSTPKSQADQLILIEEEMLFLKEVPNTARFLERRVTKLNEKFERINGQSRGWVPIKKLMFRVDMLEERVTQKSSSRPVGSLDNSVAHKEGRGKELDKLQKTMMMLFNELANEFRTTVDYIKGEMADMNTRMSMTMRVVENLTQGKLMQDLTN